MNVQGKILLTVLISIVVGGGAVLIHRSGQYQKERIDVAQKIQALEDQREKEIRDAIHNHMKIMIGLKTDEKREREDEAYRATAAKIRAAYDEKINQVLQNAHEQ